MPSRSSARLMPARGAFAHASARQRRLADVQQAAQERAGAEHHRPGAIDAAVGHADADDAPRGRRPLDQQVLDGLLPQSDSPGCSSQRRWISCW